MTSKVLLLVVIALASAKLALQPCDSKVDTLRIYPSTGETVEWDLKDTFFEGSYLSYSLSPSQSLFTIQKPFAQLSSPKPHVEAINRVTAARAYQEKSQRVWMNHFVFIEVELDSIDLFYAEGAQGENSTPPQFSKKISITTGNAQLSCLGVDYLNKDQFVLDCIDSTKLPFSNKFFIVNKSGNVQILGNGNYNQYTVNTRRISQVVTITNQLGHQFHYLFRATPAFATQYAGLDQSSLLEVFLFDDNGVPRLDCVLDAATLGVLLDVQDPQHFNFSLIDFKVFASGRIYIQTAKDGIFILDLKASGEFVFVDRIILSSDQVYEFDVDYLLQSDGSVKEVIAVLYNDYIQVVEDKTTVNNYILEITVSYPATIAISQQFLIIQAKGVTYLFSTEHEEIIYKEVLEGAKGTLINPFETELITITQIDSRRYSLTHGLLRFPATTTTVSSLQTFSLIAMDTFSSTCKVSISFKVYNATDYSVQATDELELPNLLYDNPEPFDISPLASGPNLNYVQLLSQMESTSVTAKITSLSEMQLPNTTLPNPSLVVYSDVLILDSDDERYALLFQTQDKLVSIFQCHIKDRFSAKSECTEYQKFPMKNVLTLNNFVWWNIGFNIYHMAIENDYYATFRNSRVNSTTIINEIAYTEDPLNKITSVTILKDRIYFILGNRKQIDVWNSDAPYQLEYSITDTMVKYLGFTGNWNPQRIFGNRVHNSYLFFISNEDNVVIADYHSELTIIKVITLSKGQIDLAIGMESFFVVLKSSTVNLIQEYDLQNLNSIHLMKTIPLYWYTLQTPLQTDFCSDTGVLFVRAFDYKTTQTVILIYGPGLLLRDSLLKVVPLGSKVNDGTSIVMSTGGSSQMIFYVSDHQLWKVYSYFQSSVLTLKPNYDVMKYFSTYTLKFQVSNYGDVSPVTYYQTLNLINTQITLRLDQNVLDSRPLQASISEQNIDLNTDWFDGQVVSLDIDCTQCDQRIRPIQTVQQVGSGGYNGYHIIDAAPYKGSRTLYLANRSTKRVLIADVENNLETSYSISLSTSTSDYCDHITSTEDGAYIFATCTINGRLVIHIAKCTTTGTLECHTQGQVQQIDGAVRVSQIEVSGIYLFLLNANQDRPKNYEGSLNVYKWVAGTDQVTFELTKQFDRTSFSAKSAYFSSFYLTTYKSGVINYIKVLLLDAEKTLYGVDGTLSTFGIITWQTNFQSLDLYAFINQNGQFVSSTSQYFQIKPVSASVFSSTDKTLTTYLLVTTDFSAHYAIKLVFDTSDLTKGAALKTKSILYVLNQYSKWAAINKVQVANGYAVIAYTDNTQVLLAAYQLPAVTVTGQPLVKLIGGTSAKYGYPQVSEFVAYLPTNLLFPRLFANIYRDPEINESLLTTFYLNAHYQLYVFNPDKKVTSQQIVLTLINSFNQESGHVLLQTPETEVKPELTLWDQITSYFW